MCSTWTWVDEHWVFRPLAFLFASTKFPQHCHPERSPREPAVGRARASEGPAVMDARFYVYIMASKSRVLYIGITNNLRRRIWEHKNDLRSGFTATTGFTASCTSKNSSTFEMPLPARSASKLAAKEEDCTHRNGQSNVGGFGCGMV